MNEQQLTTHLRDTPAYIEQHRARITAKKPQYRDMPDSPPDFGPKAPCNDGAIYMADQEAATIGRLASYCQNRGSIPGFPLRGFWWVKGRCLGLRSGDDLADFRAVVRALEHYAPEIITTEGVAPYLAAMAEIRHVSQTMFPNERVEWLTMSEAVEFTGSFPKPDGTPGTPVTAATIRRWVSAGGLPVLDDCYGFMVSREHLRLRMAIVYANQLRGAGMSRRKREGKVA